MNLSNGDAVCFKQGSKSKHTPRLSIISIFSLISRKKLKKSCLFLKIKLKGKKIKNHNQPAIQKKPQKTKNRKNQTKMQNETKQKQALCTKLSIINRKPKTKQHSQNTYLYGIEPFIWHSWNLRRNVNPFGFNMSLWVFSFFPTASAKKFYRRVLEKTLEDASSFPMR